MIRLFLSMYPVLQYHAQTGPNVDNMVDF